MCVFAREKILRAKGFVKRSQLKIIRNEFFRRSLHFVEIVFVLITTKVAVSERHLFSSDFHFELLAPPQTAPATKQKGERKNYVFKTKMILSHHHLRKIIRWRQVQGAFDLRWTHDQHSSGQDSRCARKAHTHILTNSTCLLSGIQMTKSTNNFLLVQIAGRRFQPTNGLHLFVQLKGFVFGDGASRCRSRFQIVQFKRLFILSSTAAPHPVHTHHTHGIAPPQHTFMWMRFAVRRTEKSREEKEEEKLPNE